MIVPRDDYAPEDGAEAGAQPKRFRLPPRQKSIREILDNGTDEEKAELQAGFSEIAALSRKTFTLQLGASVLPLAKLKADLERTYNPFFDSIERTLRSLPSLETRIQPTPVYLPPVSPTARLESEVKALRRDIQELRQAFDEHQVSDQEGRRRLVQTQHGVERIVGQLGLDDHPAAGPGPDEDEED